ncbi:MAG: YceI family protein [Pseudomonadota bacterium]|nr:YceI family protein [Pseudomonadota bacterium]
MKFLAVALLALGLATAARAYCPPGLPPGVTCGERNAMLAPAGTYALDPDHTAVVAMISHLGYSLSLFRFGKAEGTLVWDPANQAKSALRVTVDLASIATPVPGFAEQLQGPNYLNAAANPKAIFVSTAFRAAGATLGQVDGQLTLNGKTLPVTFDVDLVGAGKGFGKPRLGVEARAHIDPAAFGLSPLLGKSIELTINCEFERRG